MDEAGCMMKYKHFFFGETSSFKRLMDTGLLLWNKWTAQITERKRAASSFIINTWNKRPGLSIKGNDRKSHLNVLRRYQLLLPVVEVCSLEAQNMNLSRCSPQISAGLGLITRCSSFNQWWQLRRQKPSVLTRKGWTVGLSKLGWWYSDRAIGEPTHQDWGWAWVCFEAMCSQTQKEAQLSAVSSFPAPHLEEELSGNYIARKNHCPQIKDIFVCYQGLRVERSLGLVRPQWAVPGPFSSLELHYTMRWECL